MSFADSLFFLMLLVAGSVFFSLSEISLAASRKIKLQVMADEGNRHAEKVLALQAQPGNFFTVVQIGLNTVAILGGILGESALNPAIKEFISEFYQGPWLGEISSAASFVFVTGMFILIADLMPKRLAMTMPERIAVVVVRPMLLCVTLLMPLVWFFNGLANALFRLLRVTFSPERRAELLGSRHALSLAMLQRLMNIRSEPISTVMRQLLREADSPGLGSAAAAGALVRLLVVELQRLLDEDFEPRAGGRLAPWQFRRLRERLDAGGARPTVADLAELCGISVRHLHRQFLNLTGVTISDYVEAHLVSRAKLLLAGTGLSIRQIAAQSGFDHANSFSRTFRRATGMTPLHYRQMKSGRAQAMQVGAIRADSASCSS